MHRAWRLLHKHTRLCVPAGSAIIHQRCLQDGKRPEGKGREGRGALGIVHPPPPPPPPLGPGLLTPAPRHVGHPRKTAAALLPNTLLHTTAPLLTQCINLDKYGCGDVSNNQAACCTGGKCQKNTSSDAGGTCKTCIDTDKNGCSATADCCTGKCQKATLAAATGNCKTCIANLAYGCSAASDCCSSGYECTAGRCT